MPARSISPDPDYDGPERRRPTILPNDVTDVLRLLLAEIDSAQEQLDGYFNHLAEDADLNDVLRSYGFDPIPVIPPLED